MIFGPFFVLGSSWVLGKGLPRSCRPRSGPFAHIDVLLAHIPDPGTIFFTSQTSPCGERAHRAPKLRPLGGLVWVHLSGRQRLVQSRETKEPNLESHTSGIVGHHSHSAPPTWMYIPVLGSSCCGFGRFLCRGLLLLLPLFFLYPTPALFVEPFIFNPELGLPVCTFTAATASPSSIYRVSSYSPLPEWVVDLRQFNIQFPGRGLSVIECRLVE